MGRLRRWRHRLFCTLPAFFKRKARRGRQRFKGTTFQAFIDGGHMNFERFLLHSLSTYTQSASRVCRRCCRLNVGDGTTDALLEDGGATGVAEIDNWDCDDGTEDPPAPSAAPTTEETSAGCALSVRWYARLSSI